MDNNFEQNQDELEAEAKSISEAKDDTACKGAYLGIIEGTINRMASSSTTVKGFSATVLAGIAAVLVAANAPDLKSRIALFIVAVVCELLFFGFDWYYCYQERRYRYLYEQVRLGNHPCDFAMTLPKHYGGVTPFTVLESFSLWLFYSFILGVLIVVAFGIFSCQ